VVSGRCSFVGVHEEGVPKLAAAPESAYGLSAHDGLMMIFYLLFAHFRLSVSPVILVAMSVGSLLNPVGFVALAIKPDIRQHPTSAFGGVMAGTFTVTTIGYVGAAWSVARAAVRAL